MLKSCSLAQRALTIIKARDNDDADAKSIPSRNARDETKYKMKNNRSEEETARQEGENLNEHSDNVEAIKTIN